MVQHFSVERGSAKEALREIQLAQQLDPLSLSINTDLGFHYYYTGRYADAAKQLKLVLEMGPGFPPAHLWLGRTYQELGQFDDAATEFRGVDERIRRLARFYRGGSTRCRRVWAQAQASRSTRGVGAAIGRRFVTSYGIGLVHAGLGQNDAAFASLNNAFDEDRTGWSGCASTRVGTDYAPIHDLRSWSAQCDFRHRRMSADVREVGLGCVKTQRHLIAIEKKKLFSQRLFQVSNSKTDSV